MATSQPSDHEEVKVIEPVDRYTALAVRGTIIGTGLLGLTLYLKNSRIFAKFRHINRIPKEYYQNEVPLRGIVREVTPYGLLKVEHQPVVSIANLFGRKTKKNVDLLNLRLAGLDVSSDGLTYLIKDLKLPNRPITFEMVKRTDGNSDAADAVIVLKKSLLGPTNLNVDLVRKGFARVYGPDNGPHLDALRTNSVYSRLITRLLTCETVADRRGVGVWERSTWVESVQSIPTSFIQIVKSSAVTKLLILLYHVLRDLLLLSIGVLKQGYYTSIAVANYSRDVYKSFGRGVDRLSNFYLAQKNRFSKIKDSKSSIVTDKK